MVFFHNSRVSVLLLLFTACAIIIPTNSQLPIYNSHVCLDPYNETSNDSYGSNLTTLLGSLSDKASQNISFYNDTSNGIYGLFLCRGDVSIDTCKRCVRYASQNIASRCSSNRSAIIWFDECMLRYSNINFFGKEETLPRLLMWNVENQTSNDETNFETPSLMYGLMEGVSVTDLLFKANSRPGVDGSEIEYGLVQCTRDITVSSCNHCFDVLMKEADKCCKVKKGWRILAPSCNIRFEKYPFFAPQPSATVPSQHVPGKNNATAAPFCSQCKTVGPIPRSIEYFWSIIFSDRTLS
ncbi:cysteine-rich repeat secretory protein 38-like [Juglans regia]|uniref:Cysteine-rich repeat secretory protein 38-like n=1 Tax=Juglans regia TaxID=51240 RepID=A0A6P9EAA8_JUGRE|nr:cysteine-rich repeat secretory protein 38-like [Juglans regia]